MVVQGVKTDFLLHDYPLLVPDWIGQSAGYCSLASRLVTVGLNSSRSAEQGHIMGSPSLNDTTRTTERDRSHSATIRLVGWNERTRATEPTASEPLRS